MASIHPPPPLIPPHPHFSAAPHRGNSNLYTRNEIIFRDNKYVETGRRSWDLISFAKLISDISGKRSIRDRLTKCGISQTFQTENEVNLFLRPTMENKLKELNITANLAPATKEEREIYVKYVPEDIFKLTKNQVHKELTAAINTPVLQLIRFETDLMYYFVFTTDSKFARDSLLQLGYIYLFGRHLFIEGKKSSRSPNINHATRFPSYAPRAMPHVASPHGHFPQLPTQSPPQTSQANRALPSSCNWAHNFRNNTVNQQVTQQSVNYSKNIQLENLNDNEIKLYAHSISKIFEVLSEGLENPELYITLINENISMHGLPHIPVSDFAIKSSKNVYISKNSPNVSQPSAPSLAPSYVPSSAHSSAPSSSPSTIPPPATTSNASTPDFHTTTTVFTSSNSQTSPLSISPPLSPQHLSARTPLLTSPIETTNVLNSTPLPSTLNSLTSTPTLSRRNSLPSLFPNQSSLLQPSTPHNISQYHNYSLPPYTTSLSTPSFLHHHSLNNFQTLTPHIFSPQLAPLQEYRICSPDPNSLNIKLQKVTPSHPISSKQSL